MKHLNIIEGKGKFKCKGKVVPVHAMKAYRGSGDIVHLFLTLALDGGQW
jgi:hypothetical protein